MAQIRLDALAPYDVHDRLPHEGLLSFFYGMGPSGDVARVLHSSLSDLASFDGPLERITGPKGIDVFARVEPPPFGSSFLDGGRIEETYMRFFQEHRPSDQCFHGILGYDLPDQALLPPGAQMLLRLDADTDVPFDFVEASALYFVIADQALAARRFRRWEYPRRRAHADRRVLSEPDQR